MTTPPATQPALEPLRRVMRAHPWMAGCVVLECGHVVEHTGHGKPPERKRCHSCKPAG